MAQCRDRTLGPAATRRHQPTSARPSGQTDGKEYGGTDRDQRTEQQFPGVVSGTGRSQRGGDLDLDNRGEDHGADRLLCDGPHTVLSRRFGAMGLEAVQSDDAENENAQDADETPAGASLR